MDMQTKDRLFMSIMDCTVHFKFTKFIIYLVKIYIYLYCDRVTLTFLVHGFILYI